MKILTVFFGVFFGLFPFTSSGQIGVADPVTGNATINFWGQVLDHEGNPIAGAQVNLTVDYGWTRSPTEGGMAQKTIALKTDEGGNFAVTNEQGHGFDVKSIEKEGYRLSNKVSRSYSYSWSANIFHPNQNSPVIFKMWKTNGAEPLIQPHEWNGNVSCDGATNRFDLINGHRSTSGGLQIVCSRTPLEPKHPGRHPFDYSFQIAIIGGGIQATEDEFTYLAPENGYEPSVTISQKATDPDWHGRVKQEFYIKTAEGHYGRLSVDWYASQQNPTHLDWNCSINPSGSQNLER